MSEGNNMTPELPQPSPEALGVQPSRFETIHARILSGSSSYPEFGADQQIRKDMVDALEKNGVMAKVREKVNAAVRASDYGSLIPNLEVAGVEIESQLRQDTNYYPSTYGLVREAVSGVAQGVYADRVERESDDVLKQRGINRDDVIRKARLSSFWDPQININEELGKGPVVDSQPNTALVNPNTAPEPENNEPQNELLRRMGLDSVDQISDPKLQNLVKTLGNARSARAIESQIERIMNKQLDSLDTDPNNPFYNPDEFDNVVGHMNEWLVDIQNNDGQQVLASGGREVFAEEITPTVPSIVDSRQSSEVHALHTERLRYAQIMYRNELYTRFTPTLEPMFYRGMVGEEKDRYDALLQVARAAYVKKVTSTHPDEYGSDRNQDFLQLKKEQCELLYKTEGVPKMMKNYATAITEGSIVLNGQQYNYWELTDAARFDDFRAALRTDLMQTHGLNELQALEADVAAWGLLYAGLLSESADSRFSYSGGMHSLPYGIQSQEFRTVLHPQEYWEYKMSVGHEDYGPFGKWGTTQISRIKSEMEARGVKFVAKNDAFIFETTDRLDDYWKWERQVGGAIGVEDNVAVVKNAIIVKMPLTHFPTTLKSLWEETSVSVTVTRSDGTTTNKEKSILQLILDGDGNPTDIPWNQVGEDFVGSYSAKVDKAYKLLNDYYKPEKPISPDRDGWYGWARKLMEIKDVRLKLLPTKNGDEPKYKNPATGEALLSPVGYHNLKVYAYLATVGLRKPESRTPVSNPGYLDKLTDRIALSYKNVGFLENTESLDLYSSR